MDNQRPQNDSLTALQADLTTDHELASELGVSARTLKRYENQPNGLPYIIIAGRKFRRRSVVAAWLISREQRPNPRRQKA